MTTDEIRALSGLDLRRAVAEALGYDQINRTITIGDELDSPPRLTGLEPDRKPEADLFLRHRVFIPAYEQSVDAALGLFALGVEVTINHEVRLDDNTWCWAVDADATETEFGADTLSGLATALCRAWLIARLPA